MSVCVDECILCMYNNVHTYEGVCCVCVCEMNAFPWLIGSWKKAVGDFVLAVWSPGLPKSIKDSESPRII